MKAGIITFHNVINYGAILQCLALQEALKSLGVETEVINYTPPQVSCIYKPFSFNKYRIMSRKSLVKTAHSLLSDLRHCRYLIKRNNAFRRFCEKYYSISGSPCYDINSLREVRLDYDICLAGSDQIWNPDITGGFDPAYFLDFGKTSMIRASYAASLGRDKLSETERTMLEKLLSKFDAISVREKAAADLLNEYYTVSPDVVLDPTLLLPQSKWLSIFPASNETNEKYIFVYTLYPSPEIKKFVDRLSTEKKLNVLTINPRKSYANEKSPHKYSDPAEFVRLIANATFVVTNSFHGTAFSVSFSKQFFTFLGSARNSRIIDLLNKLDILDRAVEHFDESMVTAPNIDYSNIEEILKVERTRSIEYIKKVLCKGKEE